MAGRRSWFGWWIPLEFGDSGLEADAIRHQSDLFQTADLVLLVANLTKRRFCLSRPTLKLGLQSDRGVHPEAKSHSVCLKAFRVGRGHPNVASR